MIDSGRRSQPPCHRYEELMFGVVPSGSSTADSATSSEAQQDAATPGVAGRYRGALR
jgi:hypothetical protein